MTAEREAIVRIAKGLTKAQREILKYLGLNMTDRKNRTRVKRAALAIAISASISICLMLATLCSMKNLWPSSLHTGNKWMAA